MQVRLKTGMSAEEYVQNKGWQRIVIDRCPLHPEQDCGFRAHGTYDRVFPAGTKIARIYCPTERVTISFLPDCFSSRFPGTLADFEYVCLIVENAIECGTSQAENAPNISEIPLSSLDLATAADRLNVPEAIYDSMMDSRWLRRRIVYIYSILSTMICLFPEIFGNCLPTLGSFRLVLNDDQMLVQLRAIGEFHIYELSQPVGLNSFHSKNQFPQDMAPRPP